MPDDLAPTRRPRLVAGVALAVIAVAVVVVLGARASDRPPADPAASEPASPGSHGPPSVSLTEAAASLAVLRDWDRARSAAWARGDLRALRRLYLPGAVAGARDVAMLRTWRERGLRVRSMTMQVLDVDLLARSGRRIVLLVTDRLADARAVHAGGGPARSLPRDGVTTRRLDFRRTPGGWVLAAAYDRPLATTAVTSGSANS